jgi:hypothetical protein
MKKGVFLNPETGRIRISRSVAIPILPIADASQPGIGKSLTRAQRAAVCSIRLRAERLRSSSIRLLGAVDEFEEFVVGHDITVARLDVTQGLPVLTVSDRHFVFPKRNCALSVERYGGTRIGEHDDFVIALPAVHRGGDHAVGR